MRLYRPGRLDLSEPVLSPSAFCPPRANGPDQRSCQRFHLVCAERSACLLDVARSVRACSLLSFSLSLMTFFLFKGVRSSRVKRIDPHEARASGVRLLGRRPAAAGLTTKLRS
jgi:hypothetical protein